MSQVQAIGLHFHFGKNVAGQSQTVNQNGFIGGHDILFHIPCQAWRRLDDHNTAFEDTGRYIVKLLEGYS